MNKREQHCTEQVLDNRYDEEYEPLEFKSSEFIPGGEVAVAATTNWLYEASDEDLETSGEAPVSFIAPLLLALLITALVIFLMQLL